MIQPRPRPPTLLSRVLAAAAVLVSIGLAAVVAWPADTTPRKLRVCADPNNLPMSDARGRGWENAIAELLARDLGAELEYVWIAQRRGFVRNGLKAGACDVVISVPAGLEMAMTTRAYFASTYVFVERRGPEAPIASLDDPRLGELRVGVQVVGDDAESTPPVLGLTRRGIVDNVVGYRLQGDYAAEAPGLEPLRALARGEVDVAVVWGPFAGAFASGRSDAWTLTPVAPARDAGVPMVFEMAMGVRKGDSATRDELDGFLQRRRAEIDQILDRFGVVRP